MPSSDDPSRLRQTSTSTFRLTDPVMVRISPTTQVPLRDWLTHHSFHEDNAWAKVVSDFYDLAAAEPDIADYFHGTDMASLQRHFLAALMMVTSRGLTVAACQQMGERHRDVRNSVGQPITPEIYDRVILILAGVLAQHGVPDSVIQQVGECIRPLRRVITQQGASRPTRH